MSSNQADEFTGFSSDGPQYLTFKLGHEEYGIEILQVQEIKGHMSITLIPNSPKYVKGAINLRGTIIPVIDLRARFGMEELPYGKYSVIIVAKVEERTVGMLVDAVSDVLNTGNKPLAQPPDLGAAVDTSLIRGVFEQQDKLVMILELDKLLTFDAEKLRLESEAVVSNEQVAAQ